MLNNKKVRRLSRQQEIFVQALVEGSAPEAAYQRAYPNRREKKNIRKNQVEKLLESPKIQARYRELTREFRQNQIADRQEVLAYLTAVMRGEKKDTLVIPCKTRISDCNEIGQKTSTETAEAMIIEIPMKRSDVNRAVELLGKSYGLFSDRESDRTEETVQIVDDIMEDFPDAPTE